MSSGNVSPYTKFKYWLLDKKDDSEFPEELENIISPIVALAMFSRIPKIKTFILNDQFNNFEALGKINENLEFYIFLKGLVKEYNLSFNDFSFCRMGKLKQEKEKEYLIKLFPYLKKYEINFLYKQMKQMNDEYKFLIDVVDDVKIKKNKVKKVKEKKRKKNE